MKINALEVPAAMGDVIEERFRTRAGEVEKAEGFEGFALLRPTDDGGRWFVFTRWRSEEDFQAWTESEGFRSGHARSREGGAVATGSELLSFEVVLESGRTA